jgi:DNA-directed RNA polymerase subunit RPC12/RpoP
VALHDYRCYVCGRIYKDLSEPPKQCQGCLRSRFWKVPSAPSLIQFKGNGWTTKTGKKEG